MRQRLIAVAVVIASACTALHYTTRSQNTVTVPTNPSFSGAGTRLFTVTAATGSDDDIIDSITWQCSSQWQINVSIDSQGAPPGPQVCGGGIASGAAVDDGIGMCPRDYTFQVTFLGTQPGTSMCEVSINTHSNGGSGSAQELYKLTLTGSGSGGSGIQVSPSSLVFTGVQQGSQSSSQVVTVTNLGSNSTSIITVTGALTGGPTFRVSPMDYTSFSLGPGSQRSFDVTCTPPGTSEYAGSLTFMGAGSSGSSSFSCTGINSMVTVSPDQVTFDSTLVGSAPPAKTITIGGSSTAIIQSVALDQAAIDAGVTFSPTNLAGMTVGNGKVITLNYAAASTHEAGPLGELAIQFSVDANPRRVGISGQALVGGVGTNPATVDFGAVCVSNTVMEDVEVYASEPGDVNVTALTKPAPPFDATAVEPLPKTLRGNHSGPSLAVRATYKPTAPGDFQDAIALTSNLPSMNTHEIQLHGIAIADGIAATPDVVHFGTTGIGTSTSFKEVQFTNCGTEDLMFAGASITGTHASEFSLIGMNPPRVLTPTQSEVFMVIMQPKTSGVKMAQLVISHSAGTTTAELDGTGEGGGNKDRETYYACSAGRGAGLWPLLIALLALRRRRR